MDTLNSNPAETLAPVEKLVSSVSETSTPEAAVAPVATPAPAPVSTIKLPLPQTDGHTVGGWNRFAGYNPNAAKNKPKDGRGGPGGRR
jgi:hypothetical protein